MNEFIAWDKEHKCMLTENEIRCFYIVDFVNEDEIDFFQYIGKKDINDKKIYADCSIVEFEYRFDDDSNPKQYREQYIGYFSYNNDKLRYEIKALQVDEGELIINDFGLWVVSCDYRVENIKVIGTLQENPELMEK